MEKPETAVCSITPLRDWPHSPSHRLTLPGTYIVTAGTYLKQPFFNTPELLTYLTNLLLDLAEVHGWTLQAWSVFSNHYHFVAESPKPDTLRRFTQELHSISAHEINRRHNVQRRKVWYQYWESQITFHRSFLARLHYVHNNPVRHGVVHCASFYKWCSATWFERTSTTPFRKSVYSFRTDQVKVPDDFAVGLAP